MNQKPARNEHRPKSQKGQAAGNVKCSLPDSEQGQSLLSRLKSQSETTGVLVPPAVVWITANARQALVLSQILYWHGKRENGKTRATWTRKDELGVWAVFTYEEWANQIGLSARQVMATVSQLVKDGLVIRRTGWHGATHATWLQPCSQKILELLDYSEPAAA